MRTEKKSIVKTTAVVPIDPEKYDIEMAAQDDVAVDCPKAFRLFRESFEETDNSTRKQCLMNVWIVLSNYHRTQADPKKIKNAVIARQTDPLGGPSQGGIRNPDSRTYRDIIALFKSELSGQTEARKPQSEEDYLTSSVNDRQAAHQIRMLIQENRGLRQQVNILKKELSDTAKPIMLHERAPVASIPEVPMKLIIAINNFLEPQELRRHGLKFYKDSIVDTDNNELIPAEIIKHLTAIAKSAE